jgi:anti-sigma factor RsiW
MKECNDDMLLDYVNGALSHDERGEVLRHIYACTKCREELSELITLKGIARESRTGLSKTARADAFKLLPGKGAGTPRRRAGVIEFALSPVRRAISPAIDSVELMKKTFKLTTSII